MFVVAAVAQRPDNCHQTKRRSGTTGKSRLIAITPLRASERGNAWDQNLRGPLGFVYTLWDQRGRPPVVPWRILNEC